MLTVLLGVLLAMLLIMLAGWAFQRAARNGGWTDVFWTYGTGASCALAALVPIGAAGVGWRRGMVAAMLVVWSLRVGTYVALRVRRGDEDARYADLRLEWGAAFQTRMLLLLLLQAPITAAISIAILFAAHQTGGDFRVWDAVGLLIFFGALGGEALADQQMKRFKSDAGNRGRVCDQGLWAWSRHPNYFFEALIWLAYPVLGLDIHRPWSFASLLAPLIMLAIVRYGTGVPPLEKAMLRSKGDAYRRYQSRVSPFLPRPPRAADPWPGALVEDGWPDAG